MARVLSESGTIQHVEAHARMDMNTGTLEVVASGVGRAGQLFGVLPIPDDAQFDDRERLLASAEHVATRLRSALMCKIRWVV
jgi:hypothetical protein